MDLRGPKLNATTEGAKKHGPGWRTAALISLVIAIVAPLTVAGVQSITSKDPAPELQALEPIVDNGVSEYEEVPYPAEPNVTASRQSDGSKARIELRLKNVGERRTFLTAAVFTVRDLIAVAPCGLGAGVTISSQYDVSLPPQAKPGHEVEVPVNQQIAGDGVDRFVFRVGTEFDPAYIGRTLIYQLDVAVQHDGADEPADLGRVLVALPGVPGTGVLPDDLDRPQGCERDVLDDLRRAAQLDGVRSPELEDLLSAGQA